MRTREGQILGWLETEPNGDVKATDYWGTILGWYRKQQDYTCDYWGTIVMRGNAAISLVINNPKK